MSAQSSGAIRALHIAVLLDFAVAQPLFDMIGRSPEFLVAHRIGPGETVGFALAIAAVLPCGIAALKWGIESLIPLLATGIHRLSVAAVCSWIALPIAARAVHAASAALTLAIAAGFAATMVYSRSARARTLVTAAAPAIIVFPALFLMGFASLRPTGPGESSDDGPPVSGVDASVPVVVVIFDALPLSSLLDRDDKIDRHRYPNFAALAERSHWFRNATTVATLTNFAVPSLLTGRYPRAGTAPNRESHPDNLFSALERSHTLNVVEPVTHLCADDSCARNPAPGRRARIRSLVRDLQTLALHAALPSEWSSSLPDVTETWAHFGEAADARDEMLAHRYDVPFIFARFLEGIADGSPAGLHFAHLNVPHTPYMYLPSGRSYRPTKSHPDERLEAGRQVDADWAEIQALQRHLLQVGYCDTLLGELVARLEALGLFDRALLVVTSDHGVSVRPGVSSRKLTDDPATENPGDLLPIPLFVKLPGQHSAAVSDQNVEIVDVFPTVIDALGGSLARPVDGRSLLRDAPERPYKRVFHRSSLRQFPPEIGSLATTVDRILSVFDFDDAGLDAVYRVGPHRELLGRRVAELRAPDTQRSWQVRLDAAEAFDRVDRESGFLPAQVVGEIEGPGLPETAADLAVAVNGVVHAVTRSYEGFARSRFSAMLPERAFRDGANRVEVFVVSDGERPTLSATRSDIESNYVPVRAANHRLALLISAEGKLLPVVPGAVAGSIVDSRGDFIGRVAHRETRRIGDRVLLFAGGHFVHEHSLGSAAGGPLRTDMLEDFRFVDPTLGEPQGSRGPLRFVGVAGDVASELGYQADGFDQLPWVGAAAEMHIESWGGREGLDVSSGHWIPIVAGPGELLDSQANAEELVITGRIPDDAQRPQGLLVFVERQLVKVTPVPTRAGPAGIRFQIRLRGKFFGAGPWRARVFALAETPDGAVAREVRASR